jgi:hypothetical protein
MSDQSHVAAHDAANAEAAPPGGDTPRFVRATVDAVDERHYLLTVKLKDGSKKSGVSYNPLAYIPRIPRRNDPVWLAVLDQNPQEDWWVMGVASRDMFETTDVGRTPSAALRCQSDFSVANETETRVKMTDADWDTDNMIPDTISAARPITRITPQRTGLYTIKAGGHWHASTAGRRIMDLRWAATPESDPNDDQLIIARDEKGPDKSGDCGHSVSVDVMITDASGSSSPRVRALAAKPSVELVVFQTSGGKLALHHNLLFLQMTYQGPKP